MNFSEFFAFADDTPTQDSAVALALGGPAHGTWMAVQPTPFGCPPRIQVPYRVDARPYIHTGLKVPEPPFRVFDYELADLKLVSLSSAMQFWLPVEITRAAESDRRIIYQYVMEGMLRMLFRLRSLNEKTCWSFELDRTSDPERNAECYALIAEKLKINHTTGLRKEQTWCSKRWISSFELTQRRNSINLIAMTIESLCANFGQHLSERFLKNVRPH